MNLRLFGLLTVCVFTLATCGCSRNSPKTTLPSGQKIEILSVGPLVFGNNERALVMNCEIDISLTNTPALRRLAGEIWELFKKDVESAKMTNGVIRLMHTQRLGMVSRNQGFGFVFQKNSDGSWRCLQDAQSKE